MYLCVTCSRQASTLATKLVCGTLACVRTSTARRTVSTSSTCRRRLFSSTTRFASSKRPLRAGRASCSWARSVLRDIVAEQAGRSGMFYVNNRWLGGTLTNFKTVQKSIDNLVKLERARDDGRFDSLTKKEALDLTRKIAKMERSLGGIKNMKGLPGAMFVIDPKREHIAVREANKLGIPVVALCDTNCDPDNVDHVIPGNDDALKSIHLFTQAIADATIDGQAAGRGRFVEEAAEAPQTSRTSRSTVAVLLKRPLRSPPRRLLLRLPLRTQAPKSKQLTRPTGEEITMSTMAEIQNLRERSGAGILDCKKALTENGGDLEAALDWLRAKGIASAAKKASRIASEGLVESYIHANGKIGVLLEVNCETDFVALNDGFKGFVRDLAMHIAAAAPEFVSRDEVPEDAVSKERAVQLARTIEKVSLSILQRRSSRAT